MSSLLQTIVDDAALVRAVGTLSPERLGALIRHLGLDECGQLLALATPAQLRAFADDDLWKARDDGPGDEIDPDRFSLWLEVLLDHSPASLGQALEAMDEDLLTHAISEQVWVLDLDGLAHIMSSDDPLAGIQDRDLVDKLLSASLSHEFHRYLLLSRRQRGWDALIEGIYALDARAPDVLERLFERLCTVSMGEVAELGLHSFLSEDKRLANDALGDRELRRETRGFVSELDARAFLALSKTKPDEVGNDPISTRYLRRVRPTAPQAVDAQAGRRLAELLEVAGISWQEKPVEPALLSSGSSAVRGELRRLSEQDPLRHSELMTELGFLANVLKAASRDQQAPQTLVGAVAEVLAIVEAGSGRDFSLKGQGMVRCFARGWQRLAPTSETK